MNNTAKMTAAQQRQEFCVRWNSHLGSIGAAFPQLLAGQRFVDVTLACEGHQVHCHRLVLAACSSYFESILAENPCKHPVIILPSEIKLWEIQALVDFMYKGEVNVTLAGLPNLLRCAEQLRIRGLYGSDAALNLNQLKALTNKVTMAAAASASANNTNDSTETDNDSATTTTTATTTTVNAAAAMNVPDTLADVKKHSQQQQNGSVALVPQQLLLQQQQHQQQQQHHHQQQQQQHHHQQQQQQQHHQQQQQQQHQQQQQQQHQQQQQQQQHQHQQQNSLHLQQQMQAMLKQETNASNATEDDSADESTSNAYDNEDEYSQTKQGHTTLETTMEEDSSYVGNDEDSFGGADTEHDTSGVGVGGVGGGGNAYMMQKLADGGSAYKRIRRSEDSLAQAAKCVSKGQTFQTVSNMFNIPVSTIRFYMARKGILPKRKRGRGASTTASGATSLSSAVMSQALAQMKRSNSPSLEPNYNLMGYTLSEGTTANII